MVDFIRRRWFSLLMLGALLIRLPQLSAPYWYDEAWTAWISNLPFDRMWAAVMGDVHPVGFFILTWLMAKVAPWAMRLIPLAASLLAIPLTRAIARTLALPTDVQVIALLLMAFTPWSIYFGAELRAYSMLEAAILLAWLCVLRRWWWPLGLSFYAILNLHDIGFVYCAVIGIYALWQERRGEWYWPVVAGAAAIIAYLPAGVILQQLSALRDGYWIDRPGMANVLLTPYEWLFLGVRGVLTVPAMVVSVLLVLAIGARWPSSPVLMVGAAAPAALSFVVSWIATPVYLNRTLIGCVPFFYLLIGEALSSWRGYGRVAIAAALLPLFAVAAISPIREEMADRYQAGDLAALVKGTDPVWHLGLGTLMALHQYALPNPQYLAPLPSGITGGYYSAATLGAMGIIMEPVSVAGKAWILIPRDDAPDRVAKIASLCTEFHCRQVFNWVDDWEPMYGAEVWQIWP